MLGSTVYNSLIEESQFCQKFIEKEGLWMLTPKYLRPGFFVQGYNTNIVCPFFSYLFVLFCVFV